MKQFACVALLLLAACGGKPNTPAPAPVDNTPGPAANVNQPAPAVNEAPRRADPNAFRRVERHDPEGWFRLNKDGQAEALKHTMWKGTKPANFDFVAAVTYRKEPGPTEGGKEWDEWGAHAVAALLYFVGEGKPEPAAAVAQHGPSIAEGLGAPVTEGNTAWASTADGKVLVAARILEQGTYMMVGVINDAQNLAAHRAAMLKWAQGMATEPHAAD